MLDVDGRWATGWRQAALLAVLLLPGCETVDRYYAVQAPFDTPIDWWHQLQGGIIAEERPPPPGIGDPYPNLGAIPARPTLTDAATRRALSARLAAERDRADRLAIQDPIVVPPARPTASPVPTTRPRTAAAAPALVVAPAVPAPTEPEAPLARIEAADAKPLAPSPAPQAAPSAPAAPAAIQAAASPKAPPREPTPGTPPASGPVPELPTAAPALPSLAGIPAATTEPATPRPSPQVDAAFVPNSAVLRPESDTALRQLASRRAGGLVAVLGGGDARSNGLDAQAAALPLAWRRARVIQDVLASAGVPTSAMHVDAAALARGGIARLVE